MNLKVYDNDKNYTAIITKIKNILPIEGMNKICCTSIFGNSVIVSTDTRVGDLGIYFPTETLISEKFLSENNLFAHSELNKDKSQKGYFSDSGRVKTIKFAKGTVIGSGFWIPVTSLSFLIDVAKLKEGDEFNSINGIEICLKYVPRGKGTKTSNNQPKQFKIQDLVDIRCNPEHVSTTHLLRSLDKLSLDDVISVTVKLHGASGRTNNNIVYRRFNWIQRLVNRFYELKNFDYKYVCASRRVIKSIDFNTLDGKQHYYSSDVWSKSGKLFENKLHKQENVFYEIVGYQDGQKLIQKGYSYGYPQGEFGVYVYRIAITNSDGVSQDLPWNLLKARCQELGVNHVPEIYYGTLRGFIEKYRGKFDERAWWGILEDIFKNDLLEKPSVFSNSEWSMPEEGFVLAVERLNTFNYLKIKAQSFLLHESSVLDSGEQDLETQETVEE